MPRSCPTQVRYSRGTINPARNGRGYDCFLRLDGKRHRARLGTIEQARSWIDMTEDATGANRPPLTNVQLADAARALGTLPPGYTLTDAARALAATTVSPDQSVMFLDATDRFLAAWAIRAKPVTLKGYRLACARLAKLTGPIPVAAVTPAHVETILAGLSAGTRNSVIRNLAVFFHWCQAEGMIKAAFIDRVGRARPVKPPIGILTPAEAKTLLYKAATQEQALVPYLVLGMFAGIRPAELERLRPEKIKKLFIMLDGQVAKTDDCRTIRIKPNLRAWLDTFPPAPDRPINR